MAGVLFIGVVLVTVMPGRLVARYKSVAAETDAEESEMTQVWRTVPPPPWKAGASC
jgi:hypothetical protein